MRLLQDKKIKLDFFVNPFLIYPVSFIVAILFYMAGWSNLYPRLSADLLFFLSGSFLVFISLGLLFRKNFFLNEFPLKQLLSDLAFVVIILLGILNIILMGYVPLFDRTHNYREFGVHVLDPVFNTMSIFFSVYFLQMFLGTRKKKMLLYLIAIIVFQVLLFRRSTIMWITVSSVFMLILNYKRIRLLVILSVLVCIPLLSYSFGAYGNYRSKLTESYIINELNPSESFRRTGLNPAHYISYLYVSSPLANLQMTVSDFRVEKDLKQFLFYNIIPESLTMRIEDKLKLEKPGSSLIHKDLIAGTFLMNAFSTLGWSGMIIMVIYAGLLILFIILILRKFPFFSSVSTCILSAGVFFLVFGNFLNKLDVILMLIVYPVLFGIIFPWKVARERSSTA